MSFKDLVNHQYELGAEIQKLARNFAKDSDQRKTSAYYASRLGKLTEYAEEFHRNHKAIVRSEDKNEDHKYFTEGYYDVIQEVVIKHTRMFEAGAMTLLGQGAGATANNNPKMGDERSEKNWATPANNNTTDSETRKILRNQKGLMHALNKTINEIFAQRKEVHSPAYYHIKAAVLEKHLVDLTTNNQALWESTEADTIEDYTMQTFYDLRAEAEAAMIELQQHMPVEQPAVLQGMSSPRETDIPLPRISLPCFDGHYQQWMSFKDLFMELVHNTSISNAKKMHYLTSSLNGEPKNLIKHLPAVGANYAAAWSLIVNRYDNKRLLVSALLNKLMSQPAIKKESSSSLKSLHDITKECLHGLEAQEVPVHHWDAILSHILLRKMGAEIQTAFEQGLDDNRRMLTIKEVLNFLERRFQSLEVRGRNDPTPVKTCASITNSTCNENCKICNKDIHKVYACKTFTAAELNRRWKWVKDLKLCVNCLGSGHRASECKSRHCTKCTKNHHTLLHNQKENQLKSNGSSLQPTGLSTQHCSQGQEQAKVTQAEAKVSLLANNFSSESKYVLLATAWIKLTTSNGKGVNCRAVLDSGSQINLITDQLLKQLGGKCRTKEMSIEGVGLNEVKLRHQTTVMLQSNMNNLSIAVNVHVTPQIVSNQPVQQIDIKNWGIPANLKLADPEFNTPGKIDCLLGADIFYKLLMDGQITLSENLPILQNTMLGWVVAGDITTATSTGAVCGICTNKELEEAITRFWRTEEIADSEAKLTEDELHCESHFLQHTTRANDSRFIVRLPLKQHPSVLAESKGMAYERFKSIERRLLNNPPLKEQYIAFMREYEALNHMSEVKEEEIYKPYYFIPHHCVLRPDNLTTKLRVVFDASAHTSKGPSLNDIMYNGPTVQSDLFAILLRFRKHKYVLKTDVEKMYRQMWVHEDDRNLQLIMWRENCDQPLKIYQLKTITYGTRAAPYLATRCLLQLADEHQGKFPQGASSLRNDFYVDDGLTGANTFYEALQIQQQLISIFGEAGMKLRKWSSNNQRLLNKIGPEDQEINLNFEAKESQSTKTLGILWLPKPDVFCIKVNISEHANTTKRSISSDLAHIYDPLGLIGPVVVAGKIQLQRAWQSKLDWDQELPADIQQQWKSYKRDLSALNNATFPRHIFNNEEPRIIEIHAFADASERAYGAVLYVRSVLKDKTIKVNLLCSKSRVAPAKTQTTPRLELCAALLAAELMARVRSDLSYQDKPLYLWTDSQIVLSWIHKHPGKLPVYVANRIVKILHLTIPDQWRHVPSKQNPADILSRGLKPGDLASCSMWRYGPLFLYQQKALWPAPFKRELIVENNTAVVTLSTQQVEEEHPWVYAIPSKNSFSHVQRIIGYVKRFTKNARLPNESRSEHIQLSPLELDASLKTIIRQIQASEFPDLRKLLTKYKFVPNSHQFSSLTPFLDEEGILRVGGRISSSEQQYDAKHQMILPKNDPLVKLMVEEIHKNHYHCGPQALLAQVRQRFWPLQGKSLARSIVQRCVRCTRARPIVYNQLMGNLPKHRVQPSRPFLNSGVDYCGPFWVHFKTRGKRPQKAYLAVFCCFSTKAVHLELVTDLTTNAFIGALKRFIGRRGRCKTLYCDNATNFVGARNQLKELEHIIYTKDAQAEIIDACSKRGIDFQFIPPRSPHFGGLWEAAVKSAKHLLIKNISTASLTYEELETVVVEIEAILNSRPLIPNSSDANDLNAITPGHFLIGEELTSDVDMHAQEPRAKLLERWQLVSQLKHNFWQRWSSEYLNELQLRYKWKGPMKEIVPNTMVLVKEDSIPVLQWPLGRIIKTYKGEDGVVRVCDVRTQKGIFKRAIHRLAPLFPEDEHSNNDHIQQLPSTSTQASTSLPISIPLDKIDSSFLESDETSAKRPRLTSNVLLSLVVLLLCLPIVLCDQVNVTNFDNKPGIYFEQLSTVKRISATWQIIAYFDLEPYQEQIHTLSDATMTLQKLCDNASNNISCNFLLSYLDHATEEIKSDLSLFYSKRTKRGAIDIVGNVAHSLFGVLDSNYATRMSKTIKELKGRDEHIEQLFKKQTSLIDSTINLMKKDQLNVQAKFDEIDNRIHQLLFSETKVNEVQVQQHILMLSLQIFMIISNLQRIQSAIMGVLIDSHHDKLNPLLLTPHQLSEEILKIKAHLPPNSQLPIQRDNIFNAYKIMKVSSIVAKNHVIFQIDLPVTDVRELQLYNLEPIVAIMNNTLSIIEMSTKFLAVSPHRDEFCPMEQHEVDKCWSINKNELLCPNIQARYQASTQPMINKCEIDLFNGRSEPRCNLRQLEHTTIWHQLQHPNQWMFATLNTMKINIVCGDDINQLKLESTGLITLHPNCTIKTKLITIQGQQQIVTSLQLSFKRFSPSIGWAKQFASNNISVKSFTPTIHELEEIQNKLVQLHESTTSTMVINTHTRLVSYIAMALMVAAVIIMIVKWKNLKKTNKPIPMPRQRTSIEDTEC